MRIAFFSYEYPRETGGGGIGTYLKLISELLIQTGHTVTVFTATKRINAYWESESVFRIPSGTWEDFDRTLPEYFIPIHKHVPYDIAECTDYKGCGLSVKRLLPDLPIVVRLHTPSFLIDRLQYREMPFHAKFRYFFGALLRLKLPKLPAPPSRKNYDNEFQLIHLADRINSPSKSILKELSLLGFEVDGKSDIVPLPFLVDEDLKKIKPRQNISRGPKIIYIGRLEIRKGVIELARAIPEILRSYPNAQFFFIGQSADSPKAGMDMEVYLKKQLGSCSSAVNFLGKITHNQVRAFLEMGDIFVYPSHYESFGIACCEAMAAGKAVVGSNRGGMAEIIEDGISGILVSPNQHKPLAKAIMLLISDNPTRINMGENARARIMCFLEPRKIVEEQTNCYKEAICQSPVKVLS